MPGKAGLRRSTIRKASKPNTAKHAKTRAMDARFWFATGMDTAIHFVGMLVAIESRVRPSLPTVSMAVTTA